MLRITRVRSTLALSAAVLAVVLVALVSNGKNGAVDLEERSGRWSRERRHRGRVHEHPADKALSVVERAAAQAEKSMLKDGPVADKASDAYTAARMNLASLRTKLRDNSDMAKKLKLVEKQRQTALAVAQHQRKKATKIVGSEENTLLEAQKLAKQARHMERLSREERSESEKAEAQGLALQRPAEALLKDSQRLNDQSNLVLDQSHSAQAKALAALDLKLAQSLAGRASKGMAEARQDFALAIEDRKKAVTDDTNAAHEVREDAQESLKTNNEQPALLHVLHGQTTGGAALNAVVESDTKGVMNAEETLGVDREGLIERKQDLSNVDTQLAVLAQAAKALRAEVRAAKKEVLEAAQAHLSALRGYRHATAQAISSQTQLNEMLHSDMYKVRRERDESRAAQHAASDRYARALSKMSTLDGHQTVLKVEIARLRLQLKEAEMQRREARDKASRAQDTINQMQAQLDKEDADLNDERLKLADANLAGGSDIAAASGAALDGQRRAHALASAAIEEAEPKEEEEERHASSAGAVASDAAEDDGGDEAEAQGGARAGAGRGDEWHVRESLDEQRRADQRLAEEEAAAHRRARAEESKLKAAQRQVAEQMSKLSGFEGTSMQ